MAQEVVVAEAVAVVGAEDQPGRRLLLPGAALGGAHEAGPVAGSQDVRSVLASPVLLLLLLLPLVLLLPASSAASMLPRLHSTSSNVPGWCSGGGGPGTGRKCSRGCGGCGVPPWAPPLPLPPPPENALAPSPPLPGSCAAALATTSARCRLAMARMQEGVVGAGARMKVMQQCKAALDAGVGAGGGASPHRMGRADAGAPAELAATQALCCR